MSLISAGSISLDSTFKSCKDILYLKQKLPARGAKTFCTIQLLNIVLVKSVKRYIDRSLHLKILYGKNPKLPHKEKASFLGQYKN